VWYGWQPVLTDGAAFFVTMGSSRGASAGVGYVILADYLLAPPIIHLAHERPGAAGLSLLLRTGLPLLVGALGYGIGSSLQGQDDHGLFPPAVVGAVLGFVLGVGGAMTIDDTLLAWEDVPPPRSGLTLHPSAVAARGGGTVGVAGTF
jgi:hypothetical protein